MDVTLFNELSKDELVKILEYIEERHDRQVKKLEDEITYLHLKADIKHDASGIYDSYGYEINNKVNEGLLQLFIVDPRFRSFVMEDLKSTFEHGIIPLLNKKVENPKLDKVGWIYFFTIMSDNEYNIQEKIDLILDLCWELIEDKKYPEIHQRIEELLAVLEITVDDLWVKGSYKDKKYDKMVKKKLENYLKSLEKLEQELDYLQN